MMKYYILLITILLSSPATAHEWKQEYWLETFLRNHIKVGNCWRLVNDEDMATFRQKCSLWSMGSTENKTMSEYYKARTIHPDLNRLEFLELHFQEYPNKVHVEISKNIDIVETVNALIVSMHIAEGLTRNDK